MSKEELIKQLELLKKYDQEYAHVRADELLLEYIGDYEIMQAFEAIEKWYA
jgi:hypothetical protein